jgi:hypothetical protein
MAYLYLKVNASKMSVNDMNQIVGNNQQFTVSSTSGASTTLTVTISAAHELMNGDTVFVSGLLTSGNAPVSYIEPITLLVKPVEGLFVVSSVETVGISTTFNITIPAAISTGQAVSGAISKFTDPDANGLASVNNLLSGIQAGAIDATVEISSSNADKALPASSQGVPGIAGAINFYNLK